MAEPGVQLVHPDGSVDVITPDGSLLQRIPDIALTPEWKAQKESLGQAQPAGVPDDFVGQPTLGAAGGTSPAGVELGGLGQSSQVRDFAPVERDSFLERGARVLRGEPEFEAPKPADQVAEDPTEFVDPGLSAGPATQVRARQVGGAPRVVTKTSRTVKRAVDSPEAQERLADVQEQQALQVGVQQERMEAQLDVHASELDGARKREELDRVHVAEQQRIGAELQARTTAKLAELTEAEDQFLNMEVDPNRFWANKSTAGKVAAGIGMLLSGFGAGLLGKSKSSAQELFESAVQQDINAQQSAIRVAGRGIKHLNGALARYNQVSDNELANLASAKGTAYRQILAEHDQAKAMAKSADVKLAIDESAAAIQALAAEQDLARTQAIDGEEAIRTDTKTVTGGSGGAPLLGSLEDRLARDDLGIPGFLVVDKGAAAGVARDSASYRKLRESVKGMRRMEEAMDIMVRIREEFGSEIEGSVPEAEYTSARGELIGGVNQVRGAGVVNDTEYVRLADQIPTLAPSFEDVRRIWGLDAKGNKLRGLRKALAQANSAALVTFGGRLADAKGKSNLATTVAGENVVFSELQ